MTRRQTNLIHGLAAIGAVYDSTGLFALMAQRRRRT